MASKSASTSYGKWDLCFQYILWNCQAKKISIKTGISEGKPRRFMQVSFDLWSETVFDYLYHDVASYLQGMY